jgi:hypothetical protein
MAIMTATTGCKEEEPTDSEIVRTSYIWATLEIQHNLNDTVVARARLNVETRDGDSIKLTGGEYISCNGRVMSDSSEQVTESPDGLYEFVYVRSDETIPTEIQVPAVPEIFGTNLVGNAVRSGDVLTVYWDATQPGEHVSVGLNGDCINTISANNVPDSGQYTFPTIEDRDIGNPSDCKLSLTVTRWNTGTVNSAFRGGTVEATRRSELELDFVTLF